MRPSRDYSNYKNNNKKKLRTSAAAIGGAFKSVTGVVGSGLSFASNRESIRAEATALQENMAAEREQEQTNFDEAKLGLDRQRDLLRLQMDLAKEESQGKLQELALQEQLVDNQIGLLMFRLRSNNVPLPANLPPMPITEGLQLTEPAATEQILRAAAVLVAENSGELVALEEPLIKPLTTPRPFESTESATDSSDLAQIDPADSALVMEAAQLTREKVDELPESQTLHTFLAQISKLAPEVQQQLLAGLRAQNLPEYIISAVERAIAHEPVSLVSILPPIVKEVLAPVLQPQQYVQTILSPKMKAKGKKAKGKKLKKKIKPKKAFKVKKGKGPKIKRPKAKMKKVFKNKASKGKKLKN